MKQTLHREAAGYFLPLMVSSSSSSAVAVCTIWSALIKISSETLNCLEFRYKSYDR
jgi:hypothetical protein